MGFRNEAERCIREAENAFADYKRMRDEFKARPRGERMLPGGVNDLDFQAKGFRDIQDAKGDHAYYATMAATYASLCAAAFAEAQAFLAHASALSE